MADGHMRISGGSLRWGTGTGPSGEVEVLLDLGVGGMVIALPVAEAERMVPALQQAIARAKERQGTPKH